MISSSDMGEGPVARIEPRYLQLTLGASMEFRCVATGNPPPTIAWTRGEDGQLPDYATVDHGVFRIPSVSKADEAEYYCKATNPSGMSTVRTILYVQGQGRDTVVYYEMMCSPEQTYGPGKERKSLFNDTL